MVALIALSLSGACGLTAPGAAASAPIQAANDARSGFNVDAIGLDAAGKETLFKQIGDVRSGWIRQQVRWSSYEPTKGAFQNTYTAQVDALVDMAAAKGISVMLSTVHSPSWAGVGGGLPRNPQDYADWITFMVNRYKGKIAAVEVWNEENYAYETGGVVDIATYLRVLKAGYTAVKAVNTNVIVVFGGLTPTGIKDHPDIAFDDVDYLRRIYALNGGEVKRYYDVLGAHAGSTCNPPDTSWPDNPATTPCGSDADGGRKFTRDNAFYFKRFLELRGVMEANGEGGKPMWLTEFGWNSATQPVPNYEYAQFVTERQQADYLVRAIEIGRSYPWLGVMFVWNLNFQVTSAPQDEKWGYGIVRKDGSPRPAYEALRARAK